jgi:serine/threonine-protein kinase
MQNSAGKGELKPGTVVLGYTVLGLLAQGGMAEVYLAVKTGQPPVVVKRIRPNLVEDPQFVRMFLDEARLAKLLSHPNVVRVLEVGEENKNYALVMEFLDGRNLLRVARSCYQRKAYVPYEVVGRIVADSLAGLEHAHLQRGPDGKPLNLVHRDMSPENVVVTYGGVVKVVDFGIAKAANMEGRTQVGVIKGKLGYVAPEAIQGEKLDGRADIFAMGVTLYEMLTYTVPFAGPSELEVLTAISSKDPAPPRTLNPSVPPGLEDICLKALEKNRQRRFQSAKEMRAAVEKFIQSTGKPTEVTNLATFMDTLFPKGSDKDRLRVAQLLGHSGPAPRLRSDTPPSTPRAAPNTVAPLVHNFDELNEVSTKPTGPAWSKALQIEAMMDEKSMPSSTGQSAPPTSLMTPEPMARSGGQGSGSRIPATHGQPLPPPPPPMDAEEGNSETGPGGRPNQDNVTAFDMSSAMDFGDATRVELPPTAFPLPHHHEEAPPEARRAPLSAAFSDHAVPPPPSNVSTLRVLAASSTPPPWLNPKSKPPPMPARTQGKMPAVEPAAPLLPNPPRTASRPPPEANPPVAPAPPAPPPPAPPTLMDFAPPPAVTPPVEQPFNPEDVFAGRADSQAETRALALASPLPTAAPSHSAPPVEPPAVPAPAAESPVPTTGLTRLQALLLGMLVAAVLSGGLLVTLWVTEIIQLPDETPGPAHSGAKPGP